MSAGRKSLKTEDELRAIIGAYLSGEKLDVIELIHSFAKPSIPRLARSRGVPLRSPQRSATMRAFWARRRMAQ